MKVAQYNTHQNKAAGYQSQVSFNCHGDQPPRHRNSAIDIPTVCSRLLREIESCIVAKFRNCGIDWGFLRGRYDTFATKHVEIELAR